MVCTDKFLPGGNRAALVLFICPRRQSLLFFLLTALLCAHGSHAEVYERDLSALFLYTMPVGEAVAISHTGPEGTMTHARFLIEGSTTAGLLLCNMCCPRESCTNDTMSAPIKFAALLSQGPGIFAGVTFDLPSENDFQVVVPCIFVLPTLPVVTPEIGFTIEIYLETGNPIPECWFAIEQSFEITSVKLLYEVSEEHVAIATRTWGGIKNLFR